MEEATRRKVLRAATTSHRGPPIGDADRPRSFSLKAFRAERRKSLDTSRFRSRRYPPSQERNPGVSEPLSTLADYRATKTSDPEGRGVPLNNDGGSPVPSLSQFRRVNVGSGGRERTGVIKLMDSEGNSSRDPAWPINSRTSRRKREELSRDWLLSLCGRSTPEFRESAAEKVDEGDAGEGQRRYQRSSEEKEGSPCGVNVLPIHPGGGVSGFPPGFGRSRRQMSSENRRVLRPPIIPWESSRSDEHARAEDGALSSARVKRIVAGYEDNETASTEDSRLCMLGDMKQRSLDLLRFLPNNIRKVVVGVLRTLGVFVQIGRQIMDIVDSNTALSCTKEYLWFKIERWLDT